MDLVAHTDDLYAELAVAVFGLACDRAAALHGYDSAPKMAAALGLARNTLDGYRRGRPDPPARVLLKALRLAEMLPIEGFLVAVTTRPELLAAIPASFDRQHVNSLLAAFDAMLVARTGESSPVAEPASGS